ncbi:mucin-12-like [Pempheris klunzingeri]|uniref:mucin-12-like n=1 Tax=Pempheris klunzingeri TaxID=3127111 RepID=UPI0039816E18
MESMTPLPSETTTEPQTTTPMDTVTSEPTGTTLISESTSPTDTVTSEPAETTSAPEPTSPTDTITSKAFETTVVSEVTAHTNTLTSQPVDTSSQSQTTGPADTAPSLPPGTTMVSESTGKTESETPQPAGTTSAPQATSSADTMTSEPVGTTLVSESPGPTDPITSQPAETTSAPQASSATDTVTSQPFKTSVVSEVITPTISLSQPTFSMDTVTSEPVETTSRPGPTSPTNKVPAQTTLAVEPTNPTNTVTSESAEITSSVEATSTRNPLSTQPTGPPSSASTVTPTGLTIGPPSTLPSIQPTIPSTKPPIAPTTTSPTTTTSQTTTQPIRTIEPDNCQNGGYFNGVNCTCLVGFNGSLCQFVETFSPDTLNRSVMVTVVINQAFNEKYEDETSTEFKEFVGNFTDKMETYYQGMNIENFKEVVVTSVRKVGLFVRFSNNTVEEVSTETRSIYSITPAVEKTSVAHEVVLTIPNNATANQLYEINVEAVENAARELVNCRGEISVCPYNITTEPIVNETKLDFGSICKSFVDDPDVAHYYTPVSPFGVTMCVTVCNSLHPSPETCNNNGICQVYKDTGVLCKCHNVNTTWYLGDDCSFPIKRTAFFAGLSVTLGCLLVTLGALTAYLLINKHKQTKRRERERREVNPWWLNEDHVWSRSNSTCNNGECRNPSFTHDDDLTRPPHVSRPTALPHRDLSSNQLMRIRRTSWDA